MSQPCQCVQGDLGSIVCVEIFFYLGAFFCHAHGCVRDRDELLGAQDPHDQNIQQTLADHFRSVLFFFGLVINLFHQFRDHGMPVEVAEDLIRAGLVFWLERDAFHTQYIIFERFSGDGLFRVLHIGRNDDQIPGFDRALYIPEEKIPLAVQHIEDRCKMMRMKHALPVLIIF